MSKVLAVLCMVALFCVIFAEDVSTDAENAEDVSVTENAEDVSTVSENTEDVSNENSTTVTDPTAVECINLGQKCNNKELQCCSGSRCLFFVNRCVPGRPRPPFVPPYVLPFVAVDQTEEDTNQPQCIARGKECVGEGRPCCPGTRCLFYANRCVGA